MFLDVLSDIQDNTTMIELRSYRCFIQSGSTKNKNYYIEPDSNNLKIRLRIANYIILKQILLKVLLKIII
jgi:hypothetical protein